MHALFSFFLIMVTSTCSTFFGLTRQEAARRFTEKKQEVLNFEGVRFLVKPTQRRGGDTKTGLIRSRLHTIRVNFPRGLAPRWYREQDPVRLSLRVGMAGKHNLMFSLRAWCREAFWMFRHSNRAPMKSREPRQRGRELRWVPRRNGVKSACYRVGELGLETLVRVSLGGREEMGFGRGSILGLLWPVVPINRDSTRLKLLKRARRWRAARVRRHWRRKWVRKEGWGETWRKLKGALTL